MSMKNTSISKNSKRFLITWLKSIAIERDVHFGSLDNNAYDFLDFKSMLFFCFYHDFIIAIDKERNKGTLDYKLNLKRLKDGVFDNRCHTLSSSLDQSFIEEIKNAFNNSYFTKQRKSISEYKFAEKLIYTGQCVPTIWQYLLQIIIAKEKSIVFDSSLLSCFFKKHNSRIIVLKLIKEIIPTTSSQEFTDISNYIFFFLTQENMASLKTIHTETIAEDIVSIKRSETSKKRIKKIANIYKYFLKNNWHKYLSLWSHLVSKHFNIPIEKAIRLCQHYNMFWDKKNVKIFIACLLKKEENPIDTVTQAIGRKSARKTITQLNKHHKIHIGRLAKHNPQYRLIVKLAEERLSINRFCFTDFCKISILKVEDAWLLPMFEDITISYTKKRIRKFELVKDWMKLRIKLKKKSNTHIHSKITKHYDEGFSAVNSLINTQKNQLTFIFMAAWKESTTKTNQLVDY